MGYDGTVQLHSAQLQDLLTRPAQVVYKDDHRTAVYAVEAADGRVWVVKRFRHPRWLQALKWAVRAHPAQRETRRVRQLKALRLPVTPIVATTMRWSATGGVGYCVLPYMGESVYRLLNRNLLTAPAQRRALAQKLADLTAGLIRHGLIHADYKTSNILLNERGELWLIDTDRVAASRDRQRILNMLATLDETAVRARVSRTERWRFLKALLQQVELGDVRQIVAIITRGSEAKRLVTNVAGGHAQPTATTPQRGPVTTDQAPARV